MNDDYLLTIKEVAERVSLSRSGIYGMVKLGSFPAPQRVGSKAIRWRASIIQNWIDRLPESVG